MAKKQAKKTTKKQPIKVQLSKADLAELFTVLRDFLSEELGIRLLDTNHRVEMLARRVTAIEKRNLTEESNRILHCPHQDKFDRVSYGEINGGCYGVVYVCRWCGRERTVYTTSLTRKKKRALRKLGVKIK